MKERIKKILIINVIVLFVFLQPIANVLSYDYVDANNKTAVELKREEVIQLKELYEYLLEDGSNVGLITNYNGVCSLVTVEGRDAGTYTLEDYVAGVVKAESGAEYDNPELLKAQAVAARSFLIATKKNSSSCTVGNGEFYQAFKKVDPNDKYDKYYIEATQATAGQVIMRNGEVAVTQYLSYPNAIFCTEVNGKWKVNLQKFNDDPSTAWTFEGPSKAEVVNANNYKPRSGASSTSHHYGMSVIIAGWMTRNGKTYEEVLDIFYGTKDSKLGTLPESEDYVGAIEFVDSDFGQVRYWNQGDYSSYYYSSNVSTPQYQGKNGWATIQSHGCGPTSLAIVYSSFEGKDITPITTTQELCGMGGCTSSGSYFGVMDTMTKKRGYKTEFVGKGGDYSKVTKALGSGKSLVVALMGPGKFTTGGHFIVLTGTRSDGMVSVADPGSRNNTNTKWFSFNLIAEQIQQSGFLIITK